MKRSFWLAVLAYLLPTFVLAYYWHLIGFADYYHRLAMYRDEVIVPFGLAAVAIQALFFAWAYPRLFGRHDAQWWRGALGFGLAFGSLAWSYAVLPVAAKYRMTSMPDFLVIETAFTIVQFAIVSPLIALAHRSPASVPAPSRAA